MNNRAPRFADSQPLNSRPRTSEQAEIDLQIAEYLARGGRIHRVSAAVYKPERGDVIGFSAEADAQSRARGAKNSARIRRRSEPMPLTHQGFSW